MLRQTVMYNRQQSEMVSHHCWKDACNSDATDHRLWLWRTCQYHSVSYCRVGIL